MITNLFSIFDPCNFFLNSNWIMLIIILITPIINNFSNSNSFFININISLSSEFNNNTNSNLSNNFLIPLFTVILLINLISIIPSSFTATAQISIIIPITIALWLSNLIYFLTNNTNSLLIHIVPIGSPSPLIPIIVLIEIVSNLIRPITLTVRLVANITAGHLLIHLLTSISCNIITSPFFLILIPSSIILNTLELAVSFIQSYILCTLIALYSNEIH